MLLGLWFRRFAPERGWAATLRVAAPLWLGGAMTMGIPFYCFVDKFPFSAPYATAVVMETSIEYCSLGVALTTIAVFMVFRKMNCGGWFYHKVMRPVSEASYGMYLMHMFILTAAFAKLNPHLPTPLAILATAATTFIVSSVAAILVRRIPVIGKLICG